MELQRTRIFLLISLFAVGFSLFSAWQQEYGTAKQPVAVSTHEGNSNALQEIPSVSGSENRAPSDIPTVAVTPTISENVAQASSQNYIDINTDVLRIKIDPLGGDIVRAELAKYPETLKDKDHGVVLLDRTTQRNYVAQTGLIGKDEAGPDSRQKGRALFSTSQTHYQMDDKQDLRVDLHWQHDGLQVVKTYLFKRGSYLIDVNYHIVNAMQKPWQGSFYGQIRREYTKEKSNGMLGVQMYEGGAAFTTDKPYKKVSFADMKKAPFREQIQDGWVAMVEHYFLCAFIPKTQATNNYYTRVDSENIYNIGGVAAIDVPANSEKTIEGQFYVGPEIADNLKVIAPGLNLTVDYGILWPISQALFWLLKTINDYIGNWGWSIIFVTLIIKIIFYKLSASSYRSMGKMRLLQPKIELLKERHKGDKQQFSTAIMDLYRKEKLNPLGGCLPILIQIPVFIALYYVLLESVELRHAPFMFWIQDLSSKDPYYVLPLIMGATMFIQQKMNPAPPDPLQAKVMMLMPVIFTVLFLSFPSGLVLYWTVNNILSMAQQWSITRSLGREGTVLKKTK